MDATTLAKLNQRSVLTFFLLTVIAGAVSLFLLKKADTAIHEIESIQSKPLFVAHKEYLSVDVSDWKTYRNDKYGFEVKYPVEYDVREAITKHPVRPDAILLVRKLSVIKEIGWDTSRGDIGDVVVTPLRSQESLGDALGVKQYPVMLDLDYFSTDSNFYIPKLNKDFQEAVVAGRKAFQLTHTEFYERRYTIFSIKDNMFLVIEGGVEKGIVRGVDGSLISTKNPYDGILSTFKFIEPVDTSAWKTYRNDQYGFEFKYPGEWGEVAIRGELWITGWFSENDKLHFGAQSVDYVNVRSRGGTTEDVFSKFKVEGDTLAGLGPTIVDLSAKIDKKIVTADGRQAFIFENYFCEGCSGEAAGVAELSHEKFKSLIFTAWGYSYRGGAKVLEDLLRSFSGAIK